jgi:hypothetical protein
MAEEEPERRVEADRGRRDRRLLQPSGQLGPASPGDRVSDLVRAAGLAHLAPGDVAEPGQPALGKGLPQRNFWVTVLRDAFCVDDAESCGVYFGTRGGEVYASPDEGDTWSQLAAQLPDVLCLRAAVLP